MELIGQLQEMTYTTPLEECLARKLTAAVITTAWKGALAGIGPRSKDPAPFRRQGRPNRGEGGAPEENMDGTQRGRLEGPFYHPKSQTQNLTLYLWLSLHLREEELGGAGGRFSLMKWHPRSPTLNPVSRGCQAAKATVDIYRVLITLEACTQFSL